MIVDGITGFLGESEEDLARAIPRTDAIDPVACRSHVAANFNPRLIAARYTAAYRRALALSASGAGKLMLAGG